MSSDRVCASREHQVCISNAWTSTHGGKCIKHTTNDQNMINMNNYGNPQNLVLIEVPKNEKKTTETFYQTSSMHALHICDEQCMNMWKSYLNTCYFATRDQHFHQQYK